MRILAASLVTLALTTGAQAYCIAVPDTAATGFVGNDLRRTLCIQRELAQATQWRNRQVEFDAAMARLQRDLQQQKFRAEQRNAFPGNSI